MNRTYLPTQPSDPTTWESALYSFLAEKERRSGSMRTVKAYSTMLQQFFGQVRKTPDEVTSQNGFAFAHGEGLSGKRPSSVTIAARIACISSFFRSLMSYDMRVADSCDAIEVQRPSTTQPATWTQLFLLIEASWCDLDRALNYGRSLSNESDDD